MVLGSFHFELLSDGDLVNAFPISYYIIIMNFLAYSLLTL